MVDAYRYVTRAYRLVIARARAAGHGKFHYPFHLGDFNCARCGTVCALIWLLLFQFANVKGMTVVRSSIDILGWQQIVCDTI